MKTIVVKSLKKYFHVYKKSPGILSSFRSLFYRPFEEVKAVDNLSFSISEGELVGFIGPNGAGKTTTLKTLSGLLFPTSNPATVFLVRFSRPGDGYASDPRVAANQKASANSSRSLICPVPQGCRYR